MAAKEIRYPINTNTEGAEKRFAVCYQSGERGKFPLVSECLSVGFLMKELGLTDVIKLLDSDLSFNALSVIEKRNRLIDVLSSQKIGAGAFSEPIQTAQTPAMEPKPTEPALAAELPSVTPEPKQPEATKPPPKNKAKLPSLGN